ncbi:hypothetical protein CTAYLR_001524 [Chrysophaeum taylorii]|uniref:HSF-type DNA-binding domain-containing protein n=1 Tax=Chrysophaeum taylorii TaxID=2483200 RepID=A0AAD7UE62_9STRA|nr:hypothetical protein CTAYLR_001524 [Chrysophaeum taylorii]
MVKSEDPQLIAWNGGKIFIQDPSALEKKMSAYFRHSNFSSFQRQLNNFGFRKVEGKGKLAPCMYMHDELQGLPPDSLLRIRRKAPSSQQDPKRRRTDLGPYQGAAVPQNGGQPPLTQPRHDRQYSLDDAFARDDDHRLDDEAPTAPAPPPQQRSLESALEHDALEPLSPDRPGRREDVFESGLLLSFLENDPTSHLPPSSTMPFFDPPTDGDLAPISDEPSFDNRPNQSSMRVNIFGKQHHVRQPSVPNGTAR